MTFERALLSERDCLKIQLLMTITESAKPLDLTSFANQQQLNYAQAYNLLMAVAKDLKQADFKVSLQAGQLSTNATLDDYRRWLYHSTIAYQCLISCLHKEYSSAADFCQAKGISVSTLQRHLAPLKPYLRQFNLRFSPQNFTIRGMETLVQIFYYQFLNITLTTLSTNSQYLVWREQLQQTYWESGQFQPVMGLQRQQMLLINLSLLRLSQGHLLSPLVFEQPLTVNLITANHFLERTFDLTSAQAQRQLQTLDYLLTFSPFFIGTLHPVTLLKQRHLINPTSHWAYSLPTGELSRMIDSTDWLLTIAFFIVNFSADPLIHQTTLATDSHPTDLQATTQVIQQLEQTYQISLSEPQQRLLDQYLPRYHHYSGANESKPQLLIGTEMLTTGLALMTPDSSLLGELRLIDLQNEPQLANRQHSLVIYSTDSAVLAFAQQYRLPVFHWIKELGVAENLKRLIDQLYTLKLGYFQKN